MAEYIDRRRVKAEARKFLQDAQVGAKKFYALYLVLIVLLDLATSLAVGDADMTALLSNPLGLFVLILTDLLALVLGVGCYLYCFGIRRGERIEYLTLFDGFSFVGKIILLYLAEYFFIALWTMALIVPGIVAVYRYRFAMLNLCENPSLGVMEAIRMSKRQTYGYKGQLFTLDISFLGWILLAGLPTIYLYFATLMNSYGYHLPGTELYWFVQLLVEDAFVLLFGLQYLPAFETSQIGYFEIAKRTSGVGFGIVPRDSQTPDDPDVTHWL